MAKYIGLLTSDARGKVGGVVLSRANTGTTLKGHAVGVNPRTAAQGQVRGFIAAAGHAWNSLTDSHRTTWSILAAQYTYLNSLAQPYSPTGRQLYTQAFVTAAYTGSVPPANAPFTPPVIQPIDDMAPTVSGTTITFEAFAAGSAYGGSWLCQCSSVISAGINYTKGVRRNNMGYAIAGSAIDASTLWFRAYGSAPPIGSDVSVRVVPFDSGSYITGTPALFSSEFA